MAEEYGYQRSGRKCREKLDNLYKYYKKTKDGKVGKLEGKHYRFFRQLEVLYGPSSTTTTTAAAAAAIKSSNPTNTKKLNLHENTNALIFSASSDSSGEDEDDETAVAERDSCRRTKSWIAELVEAQMKRLLEKQEAWFEKMMRSFERTEQERLRREESWRREEAARQERERRRLAGERAWAEAREASLMAALEKIIRQRESMGPAMAGWGEESGEMECELSRAMGVL